MGFRLNTPPSQRNAGVDWHGCPDAAAYLPPEGCPDPLAHHRMQARQRKEAAFAGTQTARTPAKEQFKGVAENKATSRTLFFKDKTAGSRPSFDPTQFVLSLDTSKSQVRLGNASSRTEQPFLPLIPSESAKLVPPLDFQHLLPSKEAPFLSARLPSEADSTEAWRGAQTERDQLIGWQPLRSRHKREEKVEPQDLLKTLFPDRHKELMQLLNTDFVQKLSHVRTAGSLEGDVQQRLKAMLVPSPLNSATVQDEQAACSLKEFSSELSRKGLVSVRSRETSRIRKLTGRVQPQQANSEERGAIHREANLCRPVLPEFYLSEVEQNLEEEECRAEERSRQQHTRKSRTHRELTSAEVDDVIAADLETDLKLLKPRSNSDNSGIPRRPVMTELVKNGIESTGVTYRKLEKITAELESYKHKVRDLEVQLSVTSPRKAEEKMHLMEVRLQGQIASLEQQYALKVDHIRAAHRSEMADWKASEAESIRKGLVEVHEARTKVLREEKEKVEEKVHDLQKQVQGAEERTSREKASRILLDLDVVRLRRQCRFAETRSKALEKELIELQTRAGSLKSMSRLLSEQGSPVPSSSSLLSQPSVDVVRNVSFRSDGSCEASPVSPEQRSRETLSTLEQGHDNRGSERRSERRAHEGPAENPEQCPLNGRTSPEAKRTLLLLSSPSLHMSLDLPSERSASHALASHEGYGSLATSVTELSTGRDQGLGLLPTSSPRAKGGWKTLSSRVLHSTSSWL